MPILGILASAITGNLVTTAYESIATVSVGSGGAADVTFSSIPATFTHLQIRYIVKNEFSGSASNYLEGQLNSDTGNNYAAHALFGTGASVTATGSSSRNTIRVGIVTTTYATPSGFSAGVIDILDYANTNKYTTIRGLGGYDSNNVNTEPGYAGLFSSLWQNTNAVTSIKLFNGNTSYELTEYSHFALYGIK